MKANFTLLTLITFLILFSGCSKSVDTPVDQRDVIVKLITGAGNKHWILRKVYVNNVPQTLTDYQLMYWADFTVNPSSPYTGIWADRDGNEWKWRMTTTQDMICSFTNRTSPAKPYVINTISATEMDIEYSITANNTTTTTREVYYAN